MRFDKNLGPPPFLNRQHQHRMLMLLGGLVMVFVLIKVVAQPSSWNWFFAMTGTPVANDEQSGAPGYGPLKPVQLVHEGDERLPVDVVYASVEAASLTPSEVGPSGADTPAETTEMPEVESPANASGLTDTSSMPGSETAPVRRARVLPAELLEGVVDDRFRLTKAGKHALDGILEVVGTAEEASWPGEFNQTATFDVVYNDPHIYRGELIRIEGRCKRMIPFDNQTFGSTQDPLHAIEAWVITPESRAIPWMILAKNAPVGMPQGESIDEKVLIDCYVIQRIGYPTNRGEGTTVLCVASDFRWLPAPVANDVKEQSASVDPIALIGGGVVVAILLGVVGWFVWSGRGFRGSHLESIASSRFEVEGAELESLGQLDAGDPHRLQINDEPE
ncbi:MAG: hypothetical protein R3C01_17075 [Planctomycetaceae bacterium]